MREAAGRAALEFAYGLDSGPHAGTRPLWTAHHPERTDTVDYKTAFPSKFLRPADLGQARVPVEIDAVTLEQIGDDRRLVLAFRGKGKRLALNRVNSQAVAQIADSDDTERWIGTRIVLYQSTTEYRGSLVPCVRIAAPDDAPRATPPPAPPPADPFGDGDDIPF